MTKISERSAEILARLKQLYPDVKTALNFSTPIEMLVAVILSAQCTDARVNIITKNLFAKYHDTSDYAQADPAELAQDIRSAGFYRNKSKNIIGAAQMILAEFGGQVPRTMDELVRLPGVQRKTANVVLSEVYGVIVGIAVDTHVRRLAQRLGLTKHKDPNKIERDLMELFPQDDWYNVCNLLIYHGRAVCGSRKPKCGICVLSDICPSAAPERL